MSKELEQLVSKVVNEEEFDDMDRGEDLSPHKIEFEMKFRLMGKTLDGETDEKARSRMSLDAEEAINRTMVRAHALPSYDDMEDEYGPGDPEVFDPPDPDSDDEGDPPVPGDFHRFAAG